jgi:hypothetical protein
MKQSDSPMQLIDRLPPSDGRLYNGGVEVETMLKTEADNVSLEQAIRVAKQLTPLEKVRLIEQIIPDLAAPLETLSRTPRPLRSAYGICADLGTAPSAEEIDDLRRELFSGFPRQDIV